MEVLIAGARLRLVCGERQSGLADLLKYGHRPGSPMRDNPAVHPWRSEAALGREGEARRLAAVELELVQALRSDRAIGMALRALGLVRAGNAARSY